MEEIIERHEALGANVPKSLYMDCACCSGKPDFRQLQQSSVSHLGTSVAILWRSIFSVKLDTVHRMLRFGRERNAEHPHRDEVSSLCNTRETGLS